MANTEIFKTSFKGYNKDEVIAYIENLNRQTVMLQKDLDELNARLLQMEDERQEDNAALERKATDEAVLRQEITDELKPALAAELRTQLEAELRPQIEREIRRKMEEEMAPKYEEAARSEINQRMQSQANELRELRRRAQLYDDNREVLAELMIKAKNDAADIIGDAEKHAKALRDDAEQRYNLLISDYKLLKSNLLTAKGEAVEKLNYALKSLEDFEKRFSCMDQDVAHSCAHLKD
jgi:hypothetical protein